MKTIYYKFGSLLVRTTVDDNGVPEFSEKYDAQTDSMIDCTPITPELWSSPAAQIISEATFEAACLERREQATA